MAMEYSLETQEMIKKIPAKVTVWSLVIIVLALSFLFVLLFLRYPQTSYLPISDIKTYGEEESCDSVIISTVIPEYLLDRIKE
jgi:hypothetical protein